MGMGCGTFGAVSGAGPLTYTPPSIPAGPTVGVGIGPDIVRSLGQTYAVVRQTSGGYDENGRYTGPSTDGFTIKAVVQPSGGDTLELLPEGTRTSEVRILWTATMLQVKTETDEADVVQIDGADWEVQKVERWNGFGGCIRCIVLRLD